MTAIADSPQAATFVSNLADDQRLADANRQRIRRPLVRWSRLALGASCCCWLGVGLACPNVTTGTFAAQPAVFSDCQVNMTYDSWVLISKDSNSIKAQQSNNQNSFNPNPAGSYLVGKGTGKMYIVDAFEATGTTDEPDCLDLDYSNASSSAPAQDARFFCGFFQIDTGDDHGIYMKGYWDAASSSWSLVSAISYPQTYSIGGTLSGLDGGQSVVLQNNGADDLEVTANGDFTFPTEIPADGSYNVSVLTQPTGQTCIVNKGSGSNVAADVDTVEVSCGVPPVLNYFSRYQPQQSPTNWDVVAFMASFSEEVTNVDKTDFVVDGDTTATVTNVSYYMNNSMWVLTVSGGDLASFNGTVGINLSGTQDITNLAGIPLPNTEPDTDGTFIIENPLYRSKGSGDWSNTATWQQSTDNGATWQDAAAAPASDNGGIIIEDGHTVTVDSDLTAKGITVATGGILAIAAGATLTLGDDEGDRAALEVAGDLANAGTLTTTESSTIAFTGASDSTFTLNALTTVDNLVVNKTEPTKKLQLLGGFRLKVRKTLEVIRGTFDLSGWSQNLSFGGQLKIRGNGRWTRHASTENAVECDGTCTISDETADADGPQRLGRLWLRRFAND